MVTATDQVTSLGDPSGLGAPETTRRLRCVIVTPERSVLDEPATFIVLPMIDGELGVLPRRMALIGRLGKGQMRIHQGDTIKHVAVEGGFAQVRSDVVTILTPSARTVEPAATV